MLAPLVMLVLLVLLVPLVLLVSASNRGVVACSKGSIQPCTRRSNTAPAAQKPLEWGTMTEKMYV
jgi:hypothetical protein